MFNWRKTSYKFNITLFIFFINIVYLLNLFFNINYALSITILIPVFIYFSRIHLMYVINYNKDKLTGTYNKKIIYKLNEILLIKNKKATVVLLDIDNFMSIKNMYGQEVSNNILKDISNILNNVIRDNDIIIRWGDSEFVIFYNRIMDIDIIKRRLSKTIYDYFREKDIDLFINIGVSEYFKDGINIEKLVNAANEDIEKNNIIE